VRFKTLLFTHQTASRPSHTCLKTSLLTFVLARSRLSSYIRERTEWCISRQRAWGVPIPALYDLDTGEAILNSVSLAHIIGVLDKKGVDHWWQGHVDEFIPPSMEGRRLRKATETMDVWFDSGSSWSVLQDRGLSASKSGRELPAWSDVALEGTDQHRGWFQSLLLTSLGSSDNERITKPYHNVITHGFVLDEDKKKMSKSLGNIISPMTVIHGGKVRFFGH
jgi:isoleucyl-tRNA synthetase